MNDNARACDDESETRLNCAICYNPIVPGEVRIPTEGGTVHESCSKTMSVCVFGGDTIGCAECEAEAQVVSSDRTVNGSHSYQMDTYQCPKCRSSVPIRSPTTGGVL